MSEQCTNTKLKPILRLQVEGKKTMTNAANVGSLVQM